MIAPPRKARIDFGRPAHYRIVVEGSLGAQWRHRLGDLAIVTTIEGDGVPRTAVSGRFADQAALKGLLDILYDLHLPIALIEQIEDATNPTPNPLRTET